MFKYLALALALTVSTVNAEDCPAGSLLTYVASTNGQLCAAASGYDWFSGATPDAETAFSMCNTQACKDLLTTIQSDGYNTDCNIPLGDKVNLKTGLIDVVEAACN